MKIPFACPSCGATGSVDAASAGKSGRCKHCGHRFTIPGPGEAEPEVFALEGPPEEAAGGGYAVMEPVAGSVITSAPATRNPPRCRAVPGGPDRDPRAGAPANASRAAPGGPGWRGSGAALTIAIAAIALIAPNGLIIAACAVMAIGCAMILVGFGVGAYGAFSEDFLYGFLYLVIPFYTAYYMVTRWDDLWVWFACMTSGVGLVLVGIEMARWGGVVA